VDGVSASSRCAAEIEEAPGGHAGTLRDLVSLLGRARRLLDELADPAGLTPGRESRAEALAGRITTLIGHPVTDQDAAPEVLALIAHLDRGQEATTAGRLVDGVPPCGSDFEPHLPECFAPKSGESAPRTEERVPGPCDCGARPGQGHLLRCQGWIR
jgi:hypothetical protein